ncbi:MAG TPA: DUF72 domain-containing protein [Planctomycetota bacterium]|nr:DUF72 domain-containing protein [Planctomycetota bacterium]
MATPYIGTSGFSYKHWKSVFYPEDMPTSHWFGFYCKHFGTVELNNPFYRLPTFQTFQAWKERSPEGFIFAVKASRYITHIKRLKEPEEPLERLMASASGLGDKLGPILFQLPPNYKPDLARLRGLLELRARDQRWVLEFRHTDWFSEEVLDLLRAANVALCIHDGTPGCPRVATADFIYMRFHGGESHDGNYTNAKLRQRSNEISDWLENGLDVYAYFNNDVGGYAVNNAQYVINSLTAGAHR